MSASHQKKRIVVGVDGSDQATAALNWAIRFARPLDAEIVAVFAVPPPTYIGFGYDTVPPSLDPEWRVQMLSELEQKWCRALRESGLPHRLVMEDGRPARVIADVADREDADLVVVGRRGRGGITEMLLGSVSHELTHHCDRPVMVVSRSKSVAGEAAA
jgi:nucleotide-binding universal stress UspA family protein